MSIARAYRRISFRLFRWREIDVFIDLTALIIIWIYLDTNSASSRGSTERLLEGGLVGLLLIFSILVHELAHAWVGILCGARVNKIYLNVLGGVCLFFSMPSSLWRKTLISLAGPFSNLLLYLLFEAAARQSLEYYEFTLWMPVFERVATLNLILGLFNLLPAFPLDGGQALRSLLTQLTRRELLAGWVVAITGVVTALGISYLVLRAAQRLSLFDFAVLAFVIGLVLLASLAQLRTLLKERKKVSEAKPQILSFSSGDSIPTQYDTSVVYKKPEGWEAFKSWYDTRLARLNMPYEELNLNTRFGVTHVLALGPKEAPPVVFLSGNCLMWKYLWPALIGHYRIYSVDLIGRCNKSAPVRLSSVGLDYGHWLGQVLDGLGLARASIVAEESSCTPVFKLAGLAPTRIERAVLISPHELIPQKPFFNTTCLVVLLLFGIVPIRPVARLVFKQLVPPTFPHYREALEETAEQLVLAHKYYKSPDSTNVLPLEEQARLTAPVLVLVPQGGRIGYYKPEMVVEQVGKVLPCLVRAEIVDGVASSVAEERPEWLGTRLLTFLEQGI